MFSRTHRHIYIHHTHYPPDRTLPLILAVPFLPHSLTDVDLGGFIGHQRLRNQDALSIAILFNIFMIAFLLLAKYFEKKFPGTSEKGE